MAKTPIYLLLIIFTFTSCVTYTIPKASFVKQFESIDSNSLKTVIVKTPTGSKITYKANPIEKIVCNDENGKEIILMNSPSIETKITLKNDDTMVFYFDRIILMNGVVYGIQSRILDLKSSIPLNDISKIEVQDGRKKFSYANN